MPALLALRALPWRLIGIGGLAFAVLALYAHDRSVVAQNVKLKAELKAISSKKDEQRKVTAPRVERVVIESKSNPVAERIEKAPLPGACEIPDEIKRSDAL